MSASPPPPPPPPPPPQGGWPPLPGWGAPQWGPQPGWAPAPGWGAPPAAGGPPVWGWGQQPALPGSGRFRAQAVGELLDSAFTLYRRNFLLIVAITAVVQVPLTLFSYIVYQLTGFEGALTRLRQLTAGGTITQQQLSDLKSPLITLAAVGLAVFLVQTLLVQPVATAAMTRAVGDIYLDKPTSVAAVYSAVARRIGGVIGVSVLLFLVGVGIVAAVFVLSLGAVVAAGQAGAVLLLAIIPAALFAVIVFYTRWLFAAPIVILERLGPVAALRRSWRLVRGSTGRVLGITLLVVLITGILSTVVSALLSVATQFGDDNLRLILNQLATLLADVLILPISLIVIVLLYYDLRIRREAFDIEMLAATL
ncbi:MAG TPA: glycerophosphoryl diester phosphodiesterase membrane domain-containing protein [Candidatus Dormibacteraeota bacterium]|nr:glycerophosphoryl diester phosphodiesterase membrane domain-containing protein [Candidatus Dormibacteraeota bacterium]